MKILKKSLWSKFLPILFLWFCLYSIGVLITKKFEPSIDSLKVINKTVSGRFVQSGGEAGTIPYASVNGVSLACSINIEGSGSSCPPYYAGRDVTVSLASYEHLFGTGLVVLLIKSSGYRDFIQAPSDVIDQWRRTSQTWIYRFSIILTMLLSLPYIFYIDRKDK
jgi:hypothetical protein